MAEKHLKYIFSILSHQGNENQNNPEIPPYTSQKFTITPVRNSLRSNTLRSKIQVTENAGEVVEKDEHPFIAGGISSWYNHSGNQSGGSSENWP
jgi:NADP-dependent 3-hydroxy acid dehydrogenase YdfG